MNSRKTDETQTLALVSPAQAQSFMKELANLRDDLEAVERFRNRFAHMLVDIPEFSPERIENLRVVSGLVVEFPPDSPSIGEVPTDKDLAKHSLVRLSLLLHFLRSMVQSIWIAPNVREREFRAWTFHKLFLDKGAIRFLAAPGVFDHVAPPSPFEQSLLYLLKAVDRARYCGNPDCVAPYFLAKRRSQKYCSDACSQPAQKEFKKQWWKEVGKARRKARRRAKVQAPRRKSKRQREKRP